MLEEALCGRSVTRAPWVMEKCFKDHLRERMRYERMAWGQVCWDRRQRGWEAEEVAAAEDDGNRTTLRGCKR